MQFAELKRAALAQTAAQREAFEERTRERAAQRDVAHARAEQREKERAHWLARERLRQETQDTRGDKAQGAQAAVRNAKAARATEAAARNKLLGRNAEVRSPAFQKAKRAASRHRAGATMRNKHGGVPLTREEKRQKRMASEMGVAFQHGQARAPAPPNATSGGTLRCKTARETFIEEENRRKREAFAIRVDDADDADDAGDAGDAGDARANAISDEIWRLFGKDRLRYAARDIDSDEDMEAGADDVLREERISARQAQKEDELAARELEERQQRKRALQRM
ncbi:hypothetical protein MVES1_001508 [Malassezia vespertilionis]|uniref:SPT2 chromatin protein n=1 Tax=Malassezia vespertilionis TaxID=2020962 RepID=A0A2N1JCG7_9BASI|nr:uncharacterized protein MVES1_001508 [Malassezia vespertilionis]PKI84261.1 hypothetical protein MVES_001421 [Malassezia vespertilionis]WFD06166.1 hypothetical protein MVES1_001508 [Malassezia vespertilionis]